MRNSMDDDNPMQPSIESTILEDDLSDRIFRSAARRYQGSSSSILKTLDRKDLVAKALKDDQPSGFDCNICFDVAGDPVVTYCGHLFCWSCLYLWLHVHSDASDCPVCEEEVEETSLIPVYCREGSREAEKKRLEIELGFELPPRPQAKRIESLRQSGQGGIEEAIRRIRNRANMLRQMLRTSRLEPGVETDESEETVRLGRSGVLEDGGTVGPSNAVGGAGEQAAAVYDEVEVSRRGRRGLRRTDSVDLAQLLNGGALQNNGDGGAAGGLGGGRGRFLEPHHWFGWQRQVGLAQPPVPMPSPTMVGTSIGAFHINPMMVGNGNLGENRQFSANGSVGVRESVSSNAAAMQTHGGRVDNVLEFDSVVSSVERRGRRRGRRNDETLRYFDMGDGIPPASRWRRTS
ncbi:hypothetical protein MRB53_001421 [Persea americana]|uniref:Uncharacterized protein n=1 Tax=Persea americana TaxID=3435 RepID=A0ACC2MRX9_PERAE|nr:hypothetical protein MRB53_001421 [Persea americana]|eukprot:TRINITY_DN1857_c0_g3_i1.p1 TRINITY_DN1857_c0_g3~~TRINITY_DN1857_c0_g3_i1.p1  ORF type:complete len:404 (+),score=73.08 TRINITY_DN1857_c0_g3_i1:209-1420(+)